MPCTELCRAGARPVTLTVIRMLYVFKDIDVTALPPSSSGRGARSKIGQLLRHENHTEIAERAAAPWAARIVGLVKNVFAQKVQRQWFAPRQLGGFRMRPLRSIDGGRTMCRCKSA